MNVVELFQRLHQHRAWVNGNLLTAATTLTDEELRSPFQIGQGSIWKSLVHLYAAEYVWLEALHGNEAFLVPGDLPGKIPGNQQGAGGIAGLDDLRQKWITLEQRWVGYLGTLRPAALEQVVYRKGSLGRFGTRRSDVLLHVCTHAHYTAAQVVNMLRQIGVDRLPSPLRGTRRSDERANMRILFLHGWQSLPGSIKPTYLAQHGHAVSNPKLPDEDFEGAVQVAQAGKRSERRGRCSVCFRATMRSACSRSAVVTWTGKRATGSAARTPIASRALTADIAIGPTFLTPRSRASPLEDACHGSPILPATELNRTLAKRLR
jgi:uncharacterized damage-inducible protein DinB